MADGNGKKSVENVEVNEFAAMGAKVANSFLESQGLNRVGLQYEGERDIEEALGYKKNPGPQDFWNMYDGRGIPSVIVDRPAHDTWRKHPEISDGSDGESKFMKEWNNLVDNHKIFHVLERMDRLAGVGRYGVLLLGMKDRDRDLDTEVKNPTKLNYISPFWEGKAPIDEWETEPKNERFGRPIEYELDFSMEEEGFKMDDPKRNVHYSRTIHVAEGLLDNEVFGEPRLKKIYHRLEDLDKLIGAAPEGFWQQAVKGYLISEKEGANLEDPDFDEITDEMRSFLNGFKRVMTVSGADVDELAGSTNMDPSNPFDVVISVISAKTGIPKRILTGSERGDLASSQDRKNWFDQVENRQTQYVQPMILERFIDRLVDYNLLSPPHNGSYTVEWPNLWTPTSKEQSEIAKNKATALNKASGGLPQDLMPKEMILEEIFGIEPPEEPSEEDLNVDERSEQVQEQFKRAQAVS